MRGLVSVILAVAVFAAEPMVLDVERGTDRLVIRCNLVDVLPDSLESTLSSGARAQIDYSLRVYSRRRLFPDRRLWRGTAESIVTFDALTGRYRCQLIVNGTTTDSKEFLSTEEARRWLLAPPPVEVPLPKGRRDAFLRVRARAVFSRGTTWLVFPSSDGTDWTETRLEPPPDDQ